MRGKYILLLLLSGLIPCSVSGGKYAGAFLEIGVGARAMGMGGAFVALADDGTAFQWNPSGLALLEKREIGFMYSTLYQNLADYNYLGFALPLVGGATLSFNWVRLSVDDIPIFPELEGESSRQRIRDPALRPDGKPLGYFGDREEAYFISFAKMNRFNLDLGWLYFTLPLEVPLGVNLKLIRQKLAGIEASGLGLDLGMMIKFGLNEFFDVGSLGDFSLGLKIQDLTRTVITWKTRHRDVIPPSIHWGVAYKQPIYPVQGWVLFALQIDSHYGGEKKFGMEFLFHNLIALRLGSNNRRLTAGAGFNFNNLGVDYAFLGHQLGNVHRISCRVRF